MGGVHSGLDAGAEGPPRGRGSNARLFEWTLDWSEIDPSILGTLFERGLDPAKRAQLGAHYTDRDKIMLIIEPVVIREVRGLRRCSYGCQIGGGAASWVRSKVWYRVASWWL